MTTPTPAIEYRLHNPLKPPTQDLGIKFNGPWLDADEFNYLFRQVLAGVHGAQSAVVGHLIQKLNIKLRSLNVNAHYDPNNEHIVARLLTQLNFDEPAPRTIPDNSPGMAGPTDRKPRRSSGPRADGRTTPSVRSGVANKKNKRTDAASGTQNGE